MIIHIVRRGKPLGITPMVFHQPNTFYAIVVNGKLLSIVE